MNTLRVCLLLLMLGVSAAQACSLPVFRYALENWEADNHILMLPANTADEQRKWWNDFLENNEFEYEIMEITDPDMPAGLYFPKGFGPWITYEAFKNKKAQQFDDKQITKLWSSPASQKLIDGILAGDSLVFLISGGDAKARKAAEEKMRPRIATLLEYIELAEDVVESWMNYHNPPDEFYSPPRGHVASPVPLGMAVSFVHLEKDDALAKQVRCMYVAEELYDQKEADADNKVTVTVVFGRGRAIPVGFIDDINNELIDDVLHFITGACSCKIKNENPGHDLMLPIFWDNHLWEASSKPQGAAAHRMLGKILDPLLC